MLALRNWRQEDLQFWASLGDVTSTCLKKEFIKASK